MEKSMPLIELWSYNITYWLNYLRRKDRGLPIGLTREKILSIIEHHRDKAAD